METKIIKHHYNHAFTLETIKKCFLIKDKIIDVIIDAELLGRGGAYFPTGQKWLSVKNINSEIKYVIGNAEEGELATFKDKYILENFAYKVIDGMIICSIAVDAPYGFIYLNSEYKKSKLLLEQIIKCYKKAKLLGENILGYKHNFDIVVIESNERYITGEETSLINTIEGLRPTPRIKPPYPTQKGLFNKPTVINNIETFANVPQIMCYGSKWYKQYGVKGSYGTKVVCLSGDCKKGTFEIEFGKFNISEILKNFAKVNPKHIKCILSSASGDFIFQENFHIKYDLPTFKSLGLTLGTGGIVVFNKNTNLLEQLVNLTKFFMEESCGYCIPCRIGTKRLYEMLQSSIKTHNLTNEIINKLQDLCFTLKYTSRCPLGQSCVNPILSFIDHAKQTNS